MLTRRMIRRGVRRQNKARRGFLREPCDGLIVFGNACNSVANARKFFVRLATVLQTPESFSWDLQRCCKRQKVFRGTCGVPGIRRDVCAGRASIPAFAETFAQVARGSRHLPRRLRRLRKFHGIYRDVCAGRARLPAFAETFAQAARGSRHLPRRLRRLREAPGIRRDVCGAPANTKKFFAALAAFLQAFPKALRCL